jgi:adenylate kinase family enzyme
MRRVLVIGSGGAGKSTFARELGARTGLPVVHLDRLYWKKCWVETSKPEWEDVVRRTIACDEWVLDGNYGGTLDLRLAAADTCVFLDLPRWTCLRRALWRNVVFRGRSRPDMTDGCPERVTWEFVRWILTYRRLRRPGIMEKLAAFETRGGRVVVLSSPRAARDWLRHLAR